MMNPKLQTMSESTKQLFIAWVAFQRRSLSMKSYFNYQLKFLTFAFKNRFLRPLEYCVKSYQTLRYFFQEEPNTVWLQLPPNFLLHLTYFYKKLWRPNLTIIADCHNATLRTPWIKIPGTVFLLNRCDLIIVHNDAVKEQALQNNLNPDKIYVLEDPPAVIKAPEKNSLQSLQPPSIVCPCSFNHDEPIAEILAAAKLIPEITIALTGNSDRAKGRHDLGNLPDNIQLTGFLSQAEFDNLIGRTNAVLGLTKLDGIQLSVANEAVGANKPLVLAATNTLTKLFYKGAVYVNPLEPNSIANGCRTVIQNQHSLTQEITELSQEKTANWLQQARDLQAILD